MEFQSSGVTTEKAMFQVLSNLIGLKKAEPQVLMLVHREAGPKPHCMALKAYWK